MRKRVLIVAFSTVAMLAMAVAALAGAGGKQPTYDSASQASGNSEFTVLDIFRSDSSGGSYTDNEGTAGDSSASNSVEGIGSSEANCSSEGVDQSGKQWDTDSNAWQEVSLAPLPIEGGLVYSWCADGSVQQNNTDADAGTGIVYLDVADLVDVCVICTYSGSKTTSGQAGSDAGAAIATADVAGTEVTLIECGETAGANNGTETGGSYSSLLSIGDVSVDTPVCLLPEGTTASDATADYSQTGPNEG